MALYGKYDVVRYPSGYAVTNAQTHEWMHEKPIPNQDDAHKLARKLAAEDAKEKS